MQASGTSLERNKQLLERFTQTIKSEITQVNVIDYINAYMRYWLLYEEELLEDGGKTKNGAKKDNNVNSNNNDAVLEEILALRRINVGLIRLLVVLSKSEEGLTTRDLLDKIKSVDYGQRMIKKADQEGYINRVEQKMDRGGRGSSHVVVNYITPKGNELLKKLSPSWSSSSFSPTSFHSKSYL